VIIVEAKEMYRLIGAAESQGFEVKIHKGQWVSFKMWGNYSDDGRPVTLVAVINWETSFENALDRLRRIGLIWVAPPR